MTKFTGNWSFSSLMVYEGCAFRFKLAKIDRLPEPPRPPDNPLERGNREHGRYERYIKSEIPRITDAEARCFSTFEDPLTHLRELYSLGMATAEQDWIFDRDWEAVDKRHPEKYLWAKLDASVTDEAEGHVISVDFKTGKSGYKTIEHVQQLQLYVAISALKYEWAERLTAELWYVDEGHVKSFEVSREEALKFVGRYDRRVDVIYRDVMFRPNPNKVTCKYCPYSPRGTGACPVGV